jgi:hypothetical protein
MWFKRRNLNIDNTLLDTSGPPVSFVYLGSTKKQKLFGDHPMKIPTKLDSNWPSGLREEDYNVKAYRRR